MHVGPCNNTKYIILRWPLRPLGLLLRCMYWCQKHLQRKEDEWTEEKNMKGGISFVVHYMYNIFSDYIVDNRGYDIHFIHVAHYRHIDILPHSVTLSSQQASQLLIVMSYIRLALDKGATHIYFKVFWFDSHRLGHIIYQNNKIVWYLIKIHIHLYDLGLSIENVRHLVTGIRLDKFKVYPVYTQCRYRNTLWAVLSSIMFKVLIHMWQLVHGQYFQSQALTTFSDDY